MTTKTRQNLIESLIMWAVTKRSDYKQEADYSGMFSGSYWKGKADAMTELLKQLEELDND